MSERTFVQYKNDPNGTKWEVVYEDNIEYEVRGAGVRHWIPKSDYIPCPPPERWTDVTEQCEARFEHFGGPSAVWNVSLLMPDKNEGYTFRLRKVLVQMEGRAGTAWAFIVEKRED